MTIQYIPAAHLRLGDLVHPRKDENFVGGMVMKLYARTYPGHEGSTPYDPYKILITFEGGETLHVWGTRTFQVLRQSAVNVPESYEEDPGFLT
jgi:hypothetical protein